MDSWTGKDGRPQLAWVIGNKDGCKEKLGFWRGKIMYSKCF